MTTRCDIKELQDAFSGEGCRVLDVREPAEYESEHIEHALSLPLSALKESSVQDFSRQDRLYVLCRTGTRACQAAEKLKQMGFKDVRMVEGGLQAWIDSGGKVVRGRSRIWSLDRQVRFTAGVLVLTGVLLSIYVHAYWLGLSAFVGGGLVFSGATDTCPMAMFLARMRWNQR